MSHRRFFGMTASEKIQLAVEDLRARNAGSWTSAPPFYRLLWRLGVPTPPPLFQSFSSLLGLHAVLLGVPLSLLLIIASPWMEMAILWGTVGGATYGLLIAIYFRVSRFFLELPAWDQFHAGWEEIQEDW